MTYYEPARPLPIVAVLPKGWRVYALTNAPKGYVYASAGWSGAEAYIPAYALIGTYAESQIPALTR